MSKKILIIGAAGRIARWIAPFLPSEWELKLTDRTAGDQDGRPIEALDITDYEAVLAAMHGCDAVVNLAIASQREFVTDAATFVADLGDEYLRFNEAVIETNLRGAYHIYEAARSAGVKRVVFGSSLTVFLGQPPYDEYHDDLAYRPVNFYAVSKMWGEQLGELYARKHGLTVYCLRFGQPFPFPSDPKDSLRLKSPAGLRASVTFLDMASAIRCAVDVEGAPSFGSYLIISSATDTIFHCDKAKEIGWTSLSRCEEDGSITQLSS